MGQTLKWQLSFFYFLFKSFFCNLSLFTSHARYKSNLFCFRHKQTLPSEESGLATSELRLTHWARTYARGLCQPHYWTFALNPVGRTGSEISGRFHGLHHSTFWCGLVASLWPLLKMVIPSQSQRQQAWRVAAVVISTTLVREKQDGLGTPSFLLSEST